MESHNEDNGEETPNQEGPIDTPPHCSLSDDVKTNAPLPLIMRRIPRLLRFDDGPPEATGLSLDAFARGTILMSSLFMGPALLTLANKAAQEKCNDCGDDARIYGMKPSSLLSNIGMCDVVIPCSLHFVMPLLTTLLAAIVTGVLSAVILPLFGAIVDHTPHRRQVGIWSAAFLAMLKGAEAVISAQTWFFVAILQTISGALYFVHTSATWAYTSELTDNHKQQTKYNTYFFVILYVSTLIFLGEVLILAFSMHTDDVGTARISQVITSLTSSVFFGFAWRYLFRDRPVLSCLPEGSTLVGTGFQRIRASSIMIHQEMPALKMLMCAIMSSESATAALITIATTYMSHFLEMNANEIGVVFLAVLTMGAPGSKLGEYIALRYNPLISAKACVIFFIVSTTLASFLLTGPKDKKLTAVFGTAWGLALGWLHPMHSTLFITITPTGQETELMSMYLFCGQVLSWLPPLLFTILNEAGVSMSVGLASLNLFFLVGLICLHFMGDYQAAREQARTRGDLVPTDESVSGGQVSLPPML